MQIEETAKRLRRRQQREALFREIDEFLRERRDDR
jgi:hypothetical protein